MPATQFRCEICGDGFDQKSRFERHMATSHPERAPSAADVEKALSGIQYPKRKEELIRYASQQVSDKDLLDMINSLPNRTYRDSAEVAIALGEVKRAQGVRSAEEVARTEPPSVRGGKAASEEAVSAAAIAKALSGVDFPKRKDDLREYVKRHAPEAGIKKPEAVVNVIDRLPDKEYKDMADVEKSVGQLL